MSCIDQQDRFVTEFFMPYELVVIAPPSHQLVGQSSLTISDLQQETFLLHEEGSGSTTGIEKHFAQMGIPLQNKLELGSTDAIKEGVIAGLGIAVVERESVTLEVACRDLVMLDVQEFPLQRPLFIVSLKGRQLSLAAIAFRQFLLHQRTNAS